MPLPLEKRGFHPPSGSNYLWGWTISKQSCSGVSPSVGYIRVNDQVAEDRKNFFPSSSKIKFDHCKQRDQLDLEEAMLSQLQATLCRRVLPRN